MSGPSQALTAYRAPQPSAASAPHPCHHHRHSGQCSRQFSRLAVLLLLLLGVWVLLLGLLYRRRRARS
jgi:hypothetical protein